MTERKGALLDNESLENIQRAADGEFGGGESKSEVEEDRRSLLLHVEALNEQVALFRASEQQKAEELAKAAARAEIAETLLTESRAAVKRAVETSGDRHGRMLLAQTRVDALEAQSRLQTQLFPSPPPPRTEEQKRDEALAALAATRKHVLALARSAADDLSLTSPDGITSPQVLAKLRRDGHGQLLDSVDRRFMGVVFRSDHWRCVGSVPDGSHKRNVPVWRKR